MLLIGGTISRLCACQPWQVNQSASTSAASPAFSLPAPIGGTEPPTERLTPSQKAGYRSGVGLTDSTVQPATWSRVSICPAARLASESVRTSRTACVPANGLSSSKFVVVGDTIIASLAGLVLGAWVLLATGTIGATPTTHMRFAGEFRGQDFCQTELVLSQSRSDD